MFLISALIIYLTPLEDESNIESIFIRDSFSKFFQVLILLSVSCLLFMSKKYLEKMIYLNLNIQFNFIFYFRHDDNDIIKKFFIIISWIRNSIIISICYLFI